MIITKFVTKLCPISTQDNSIKIFVVFIVLQKVFFWVPTPSTFTTV